jgi:hypothetical protein
MASWMGDGILVYPDTAVYTTLYSVRESVHTGYETYMYNCTCR